MSDLVSRNWDTELAGGTYEEIRSKCLFACIWSERPEGGYNSTDFEPFIALKKINNQGVDAYEGINLREGWQGEYPNGKLVVNVSSKCYKPLSFFESDSGRLSVFKDPDEVIPIFLNRWKQ